MHKQKYDFIICGAGPVGLAAAISAAMDGASVVLLEKEAKAGAYPRGESMAYFHLLDHLLGKDWLQQNYNNDPSFRRFHSPGDKKSWLIDVYNHYYFFDWFRLLKHMEKRACKLGVEILYRAKLIDFIEKDDQCLGVIYQDNKGKEKMLHGLTTLNCTGHTDLLGKKFSINRAEFDCPTIKYLSKHAPAVKLAEHAVPQFYIIPPKMLSYAPDLPAAVAYVFPLQDGHIEAGLMLRLATFKKLKAVKIPDKEQMLAIWNELTSTYPGFSEFFTGAKADYQELTVISNRKMLENIIPHRKGGLVLLGDLTGFSDANGSSGLYYGMAQADFWVNQINMRLKGGNWTKKFIKEAVQHYHSWDVYRYIKKSYKDIKLAEHLMFKTFGSEFRLNLLWRPLMMLLQFKTKR